jgi:hypothetical protein
VFDRLLDSTPFTPGATGSAAAATVTAGAAAVTASTDYASNGAPGLIIFPAFGDFRADGPSLVTSASPALPAARTVTFALNGAVVRAKDGKTAFTDGNDFKSGSLTFTTAPLSASITPPAPPPPAADAGACAAPPTQVALDATATITFNSPVDPAAIAPAVTATAGGAPIALTLKSDDGLTVTVAPNPAWPANTTVTLTVAATATDKAGEALGTGAPDPATFPTGAQ